VVLKAVRLCQLLLLLCSLWHTNAVSEELGKTIRIATGEWPPYLSTSLPDQGCIAQMLTDVYQTQQINVKLVFTDWMTAYARAQSGIFDATAYWFDKPERRQAFIFADQHITLENSYFFYNKSAPIEFYDWHDLSGKTIIINKGFSYTNAFFDNLRNFDIRTYTISDEKLNFKMLYLKRGDLTILSEKTSVEFLRRMPKNIADQIVKHSFPPLVNKGYVLFSRNSDDSTHFKTAFDQGFKQLMADPAYRKQYVSQCSQL
jgi:ABC-type amino acid transport substrate-binding protein